jgi:hypothetical protein
MRTKVSLDVLRVKSPCTEDWNAMGGDERVRFCAGCGRDVHNLSALPREEAERLLCEAAGRLCVRFERTEQGAIKTLEYAPRISRRSYLFWTALGVVGAAAVATGRLLTGKPAPAPAATPPAVPQHWESLGEVYMVPAGDDA